ASSWSASTPSQIFQALPLSIQAGFTEFPVRDGYAVTEVPPSAVPRVILQPSYADRAIHPTKPTVERNSPGRRTKLHGFVRLADRPDLLVSRIRILCDSEIGRVD